MINTRMKLISIRPTLVLKNPQKELITNKSRFRKVNISITFHEYGYSKDWLQTVTLLTCFKRTILDFFNILIFEKKIKRAFLKVNINFGIQLLHFVITRASESGKYIEPYVCYVYILWMSVTSPNKSIMKRMVIPKAVCVQLPDYILIWRIIACAEVWRCFDFARGPRHIFGNFIIPLIPPPSLLLL